MQNFNLHPDFYNQPINLNQEEFSNPKDVIFEFFSDIKLIEVRYHFSKLLETALTGNLEIYANPEDRDTVLYVTRRLEKLIEAAWLINI